MATLFISSFSCPHCSTKCSFFGNGVKDNFVLWCTGCHKGVFFQVSGYNIPKTHQDMINIDPDRIEDYYPKEKIIIDKSIPNDIGKDFDEAIRCNSVSASKATVTMCRRTLQNACILKGAKPNSDLIIQIDELESLRLINPSLKEIAHTIRKIGNWGAHPQKDSLKDVIKEDAEEILKFTFEFLDELFLRPARLESLKKRKGI